MSEKEKKHYVLVDFGENSQLKIDLNRAVASLVEAEESCYQPHLCLNNKDGIRVIGEVALNPEEANTRISIFNHLIYGGGSDVWLNVYFSLFLNKIVIPTNHATLSPRQTGYVVRRLPLDSQKTVLNRIKIWYLEDFKMNFLKALETISDQLKNGDPLLEDDHKNRVFDIHGGRSSDVPYTESEIAGEEVFWPIYVGRTMFHSSKDGLGAIDEFLMDLDADRRGAVQSFLNLARALRP